MRTPLIRMLLICLLSPAAIAVAQEAAKPAPSVNPLTDYNRFVYRVMQGMLVDSAEKMSEEQYKFKPVDSVRTFGQLVAHVADSQYHFCASVLAEKTPTPNVEKTKTSKTEIIAALKEAFVYCDKAYASLTDENADEATRMFGGMPRLGVLSTNNVHSALHYGNIVTYLRMNDIVPPSSEPGFMEKSRAKR